MTTTTTVCAFTDNAPSRSVVGRLCLVRVRACTCALHPCGRGSPSKAAAKAVHGGGGGGCGGGDDDNTDGGGDYYGFASGPVVRRDGRAAFAGGE